MVELEMLRVDQEGNGPYIPKEYRLQLRKSHSGNFHLPYFVTTAKIPNSRKRSKVFYTSSNLNKYQIPHLLSTNRLNYAKVPVINKAGSQWCQKPKLCFFSDFS